MADESDVVFEVRGRVGFATLQRPEHLNALTLPMIRALAPTLAGWARDPTIRAVALRGAGGRAFCAGGDIRAVCETGREGDPPLREAFFREEYRLNRRIHRFPKPYVALLDGIVMGGGVGLSVYGSHRVATERTVFAMPETGIGLFPDVGGSYFLARLPGRLGTYLALTGERLGPADLLAAGIATHFVPHGAIGEVERGLEEAVGSGDTLATVDALLARFAADPGAPTLGAHRGAIDACFAAETVEGILRALEALPTEWARATRETLLGKSPTSLKVTLRQLQRGAQMTLEEALVMEYRLSQRFVEAHDFCEGVRAALVDKDHRPAWRPSRLADVTEAEVEAYFAPLEERDLTFPDEGV